MPLAYWSCVIGSVIFYLVTFMWMARDKENFRFKPDEAHHAYWGSIAIVVAIAVFPWWPRWITIPIFVIGWWMFLDDCYQHHRQAKDPDYQGFLHRVYWALWTVVFGK